MAYIFKLKHNRMINLFIYFYYFFFFTPSVKDSQIENEIEGRGTCGGMKGKKSSYLRDI